MYIWPAFYAYSILNASSECISEEKTFSKANNMLAHFRHSWHSLCGSNRQIPIQKQQMEVKAMTLFNEMADIAMKEVGGGLILLTIAVFYCVFLIALIWKRLKSMVREIRLTESEDFRTVATTTANVGSGLVAVTQLDGLSGLGQIDVGPADIGLELDGCNSIFDCVLHLLFSIFN
jgi:hypothetical protein